MRFLIDHSQPPTSMSHRWTENSYDGSADVLHVPPHWHKHHTERMTVQKGRVKYTLEGVTHILTPESPALVVPPWHTHSIDCFAGEPALFREQTDPTGRFKEEFFRDFFRDSFPKSVFHAFRASYDGDLYFALPGGVKLIDQLVLVTVGGLTKIVGHVVKALGRDPGWMLPLR